MRYLICIAIAMSLAGCSSEPQKNLPIDLTPTASDIKLADRAVPSDFKLASMYDRSCRSCHSVDGMEAPLTGHKVAWQARIDERGRDGLLASTKNGREGMPAMGQCNDCTDADLNALIRFMERGQ